MKPDRWLTINSILTLCLRLGSFLCFAGWTWGHLYWEGPYGILLWQDSLFDLAGRFGLGWEEFVGTGENPGVVQKWISAIGWLYLICAIVSITVRNGAWFQMSILVVGSGLLCVLAYAKFVASQRQLPMLVEHGGQMLIPILLVMALALGARHRITTATAILAFIMTFAGHGAYAIGFWPTPASFYSMTSVILNVNHGTAGLILKVAGVLDFMICVGLLVPILRVPSVLYGAAWGFLTALARPVSGMSTGLNYWGADLYLHEAVLRAPHFMIPLYLVFLWYLPGRTDPDRNQLDQASSDLLTNPETIDKRAT